MARNLIEQETRTYRDLMQMDLSCTPLMLEEGRFGENPCIVTEYIEWSIVDYLENNMNIKISFSQILVQMIEVLEELHSKGYMH